MPRLPAALMSAAAALLTMTAAAQSSAPASVQTMVQALDSHRVTLDVYPVVGLARGATILSHGFTRSRRTLAGHAQALADAGVLALTPDLPCTFDFRCNSRALAALVASLRSGGVLVEYFPDSRAFRRDGSLGVGGGVGGGLLIGC